MNTMNMSDENSVKHCPHCENTGYEMRDDERVDCPTCKGRGWVSADDQLGLDDASREKAWQSALASIRERGGDPEAIIAQAAKNLSSNGKGR